MQELIEFRIDYDFARLLFKEDEGKNVGTSIRIIEISKDDPRFKQIPIIDEMVKEKYDRGFFYSWEIKRKYTKHELEGATLFHLKIKTAFEPPGELCGTLYDETKACEICGANRRQISPLILKKSSIPRKDIAREVVISTKFAEVVKQRGMKGVLLEPIFFKKEYSNYYQLIASPEVELSKKTITGDNPFKKSSGAKGAIHNISGYDIVFEPEVYICPKGHLIGLNLLSEPFVLNTHKLKEYDFFASKQKLGVKRGLLRPEPLYFCSPAFIRMIEEEKLSGFDFEIANIEDSSDA
jgi:hypothetical protein